MKNSTDREQTVNHYQSELEGAWASVDQKHWRVTSAGETADGPGPYILALAFAATALIVMGVALSLVS
jgi:hypothetical protein